MSAVGSATAITSCGSIAAIPSVNCPTSLNHQSASQLTGSPFGIAADIATSHWCPGIFTAACSWVSVVSSRHRSTGGLQPPTTVATLNADVCFLSRNVSVALDASSHILSYVFHNLRIPSFSTTSVSTLTKLT